MSRSPHLLSATQVTWRTSPADLAMKRVLEGLINEDKAARQGSRGLWKSFKVFGDSTKFFRLVDVCENWEEAGKVRTFQTWKKCKQNEQPNYKLQVQFCQQNPPTPSVREIGHTAKTILVCVLPVRVVCHWVQEYLPLPEVTFFFIFCRRRNEKLLDRAMNDLWRQNSEATGCPNMSQTHITCVQSAHSCHHREHKVTLCQWRHRLMILFLILESVVSLSCCS